MSKRRKTQSAEAVQQVLLDSKRRCCICYHEGNELVQEGSVAQITRPSDVAGENTDDNLVFLCVAHHRDYTSRGRD